MGLYKKIRVVGVACEVGGGGGNEEMADSSLLLLLFYCLVSQ